MSDTTTGRPGRRRDVRCPDCGQCRTVSLEHACRIAKGVNSPKCSMCKRPPVIRVTEEHRQYWLERAGVPATAFTGRAGSRRYVRENGLPDALHTIAASAAFAAR